MLRSFFFFMLFAHSVAVLLNMKLGGEEYRQKQFNIQDLQYYSLVSVGKQVLHAVMDTGSVDLIVISDKCLYQCGAISRLFHPRDSTSYTPGTDSQVLSYGSGDLVGREGYDEFSIGPLTTGVQPFWEVVDAKMPLLLHSDFEVIVGLGPIDGKAEVMSPDGDNELAYAGVIRNLNITKYGFCLMSELGAPGYLIWNDKSTIDSPHLFVAVNTIDSGYWMTRLSDVRLGHKKIACQTDCGVIIDSGTSLLALPKAHYARLQHSIWKLGPKCNDISSLPNLYFKLGGHDFALPPDAYLGEVQGFVGKTMSHHFTRTNVKAKTSCQEALMHVNIESSLGPTWVFGMPFFRSFYTVFEQGPTTKMHFAKANSECKPTSTNMELYPAPIRTTARAINAEKLRFSPGVQKVISLRLLEREISNGTEADQ